MNRLIDILCEKGSFKWRKNGGKKVLYIKFTQEALWIVMATELVIYRGSQLSLGS